MFTELKKYRLWYDGKKSYTYDQLCAAFFDVEDGIQQPIFITENDERFEQYFKLEYINYPIKVNCDDINCDILPSVDTSYNIYDYVIECFIDKNINETDEDILNLKLERIEQELQYFKILQKEILLYMVVSITNYFNLNKIVWSARGSSSASYVLYVLGVHHIDSFLYELDPKEFFKIV